MSIRRSREPALWLLFSGGGMLAALCFPILAVLLWIAPAVGWPTPSQATLIGLAHHVVVRVFLFALITLSLFHWAHRFRYTLYDGLQLYHLNQLIAVLTYGMATLLSIAGAVVIWS